MNPRSYIIGLLALLLIAQSGNGTEFDGQTSELEPFMGTWEGGWDDLYPVKVVVKDEAGKLQVFYLYKSFPSEPKYISESVGSVTIDDEGQLRIGRFIFLQVPRDESRKGKELIATQRNAEKTFRAVLKRVEP